MAWRQLQSHSGQVRHTGASRTPAGYARRALLRAAVFDAGSHEPWASRPAVAARVAIGVLAEVREDAIVLDGDRGTELFAVSPSTVTWLGARTSLSALRRGDPLTIRYQAPGGGASGPPTAERIWARVGRVTGTIIDVSGDEFLVDAHGRDRQRIVAPPTSLRKIQVRFPRLAPGYLLDVIGTRHHDYLLAVAPATAQPPYRAADAPTRPSSGGPIAMSVSGSAVWHEPDREPPGLLGVGYPALDPEAGGHARAMGCVRLPYLSLGSLVRVRNECTGQTATLPVTSDGVTARQFCDRCIGCGTSPKGRVADLTMAAFVELGGDLEDGCFNATLTTMLVLPGGTCE